MWLSQAVVKSVNEAGVKVFYVTFAATRIWAAERDRGEPLIFSGWYWGLGPREGGPFRSQSSAYRDAYFRVVRRRAPPAITARNDLFERNRQMEENNARARRRPRPGTTLEAGRPGL